PLVTAASRLGALAPWYALFGGALGWALHIGLRYPLVPLACKRGWPLLLHGVTAVSASIAVGAAVVAWRLLRRTSNGPTAQRLRFMAQVGLLLDVLFLLVIGAELLPTFIQDMCAHV